MKLTSIAKCSAVSVLSLALLACQTISSGPAPVSEIHVKPDSSSSSGKGSNNPAKPQDKQDKDWRPDSYTVKKGDTLYSIGLEHGFDYKDIAQLNQIEPPYIIKIGQPLKLKELKAGNIKPKTVEKKSDDSPVIKPLNSEAGPLEGKSLDEPIIDTTTELPANPNTPSQGTPLQNNPAQTPINTSPSNTQINAHQNPTASVTAPKEVGDINDKLAQQSRPTPNIAPSVSPSNSSASSTSSFDWVWPAKGKIINPFADGGNAKGIDIEGTLGQEVNAAGSGKVIYNGGDLRGYGNMVIIKHDKDLLSVYAHNSKSLVKEGQQIVKGQKIAEMGSSGTDKVKLHFEIRYQGKSVDPLKYLGNLAQ
jgi:lipoprotein NlpD